jgi:DNA-directed RNA polymerase subunit RPC12/RpoP
MSGELEKDMDDEVYEDSFYSDEEEELADEDENSFDEEESDEVSVTMSYVCEDCDYRWDDFVTKRPEQEEEEDIDSVVCPMCGSMNVSQI